MNTQSIYTLEGVFTGDQTAGNSYNITYDTRSKWGTLAFDNVRGYDMNAALSLLKICDTIIGISAVNEKIGFCVGDKVAPFSTTISNVMSIIKSCCVNTLWGKAGERMSYEFADSQLTRLTSPAGFKEIRKEMEKSIQQRQQGGGDCWTVNLNTSPAVQFIVSFVMTWVNCLLTETPYDKGELIFRGSRCDIPKRDIYSIIRNEFVCEDESRGMGTWTVGVVVGTDGGPLPKEMFRDGECEVTVKKSKKRKGKKGKKRKR